MLDTAERIGMIQALGLVSQRSVERSVGRAGTARHSLNPALATKPFSTNEDHTATARTRKDSGPFLFPALYPGPCRQAGRNGVSMIPAEQDGMSGRVTPAAMSESALADKGCKAQSRVLVSTATRKADNQKLTAAYRNNSRSRAFWQGDPMFRDKVYLCQRLPVMLFNYLNLGRV